MKRVAVVNDDQTFIDLVADILEEEGWGTIRLHEGDRAFEVIKHEQPDLIILDIRMEHPDTGWHVLSLLLLDPQTRPIPVIMCSADWTALAAKEDWLRERGVGILPRPFDLDDLFRAVDGAMSRTFPRMAEHRQDA